MRTIHPLPQEIISKIAAGEVIERPAYAVKELVENALDAGADSMSIYLEEAGLKKITVIDNGYGMNREDLRESVKLHTTSKLRISDDLTQITTLGFRGEALASIASMSNLTIASKTKDGVQGNVIEITDGKEVSIEPIGMPHGTRVIVSNLFHSVPGRKKFLKSKQTELRHIIDVVTNFALAYPQKQFLLTHKKRRIIETPKEQPLYERIKMLLGKDVFANLLPITHTTSYLTISGFITKPQAASFSSHKQFLFINNRAVKNGLITSIVREAYGTLLAPKSYPTFFLFVSLPYDLVDINVHPRKEEVRFIDTQMIRDGIHTAVTKTLMDNNLLYYSDNMEGIGLGDANSISWKKGTTKLFAGRVLKENQLPWDIRPLQELTTGDVIQVHNLYLVAQTKFGIAFIDQHAAHERILYEQFSENFIKQKGEQGLYHFSSPEVLTLSLSDHELLKEQQDTLQRLGFTLEVFQDTTLLLHTVPLLFKDRKPADLIGELLDDLRNEKDTQHIDRISNRMLAYLACRAAVKAGEHLTKKQAKDLVVKLEKTNNNTTCPHGRPTKVIIPLEKMHRMFKR